MPRAARARDLAQAPAELLKRDFGARRVWLIGSLARGDFGLRCARRGKAALANYRVQASVCYEAPFRVLKPAIKSGRGGPARPSGRA